jgi:hypothetical protein
MATCDNKDKEGSLSKIPEKEREVQQAERKPGNKEPSQFLQLGI